MRKRGREGERESKRREALGQKVQKQQGAGLGRDKEEQAVVEVKPKAILELYGSEGP